MPKLDGISDSTLEKHKAAIDEELKTRALKRGGQEFPEFQQLHSLPGCDVQPYFVKRVRSGFYSATNDYEVSGYIFEFRCLAHESRSAEFGTLSWIKGAIES